jgi:hypothetical protein
MPQDVPPPLSLRVRACTLHVGRFRWDIMEFGRPVQSSPSSFLTTQEAEDDGRRAIDTIVASMAPRSGS